MRVQISTYYLKGYFLYYILYIYNNIIYILLRKIIGTKKTDITDIDIAKDCSFVCEKSRFSSKIQDFLEKHKRISENLDLIFGKEASVFEKDFLSFRGVF